MLEIKKYKFAVEEVIQNALESWLNENGIPYEFDVMYEVPDARFRIYTITYAFMKYGLIKRIIDEELNKLREHFGSGS